MPEYYRVSKTSILITGICNIKICAMLIRDLEHLKTFIDKKKREKICLILDSSSLAKI